MSCDNSNIYNKSCCPDTPYPSVGHESVPSLIDNLVNALYGEITKTVSGGRVVWNIPCDPAGTANILGVTRNAGEGLMCYLIRALNSTSAIFTGTFVGNLVGNAATATSLQGAANTLPYQSALNVTSFLPFGTSGQVLGILGSSLTWVSAPAATTASAIVGGTAGSVLWQSGVSATGFTGAGTAGQILTSAGAAVPTWQTNFAGNAASASILQTSRSITLAGDVAGTNSFNGSSAITINTTIQPNSVALGTDTTGNYVATIADGTSGAQTGTSGLTIVAPAGETTAATLALANSGVVAGTYGTNLLTPVITVDARGRVTAASTVTTLSRPGVSQFPLCDNGGGNVFNNATAFLDTNNEVRVAGAADVGRLGTGFVTSTTYPATTSNNFLIANFQRTSNEVITRVYTSLNNLFILTDAGNVYGTGSNASGQIGDSTIVDRGIFTRALVPSPVADFSVSNGDNNGIHCLAVTTTGQLYAWGENAQGQCGNGGNTDVLTPTLISGGALTGKTISKCFAFGATNGCSFVTDTNNDVYSTGYNGSGTAGPLGLGDVAPRNVFTQITSRKASAVFAVSCPNSTYPNWVSTFLLWQGNVWACGKNDAGQLGISSLADQSTFQPITAFTGNVATLSCGGSDVNQPPTVAALLTNGEIRLWGRGLEGQIGNGSFSNQTTPQNITGAAGWVFTKIQVSGAPINGSTGSTVYALRDNGQLYAWGYQGPQMGDGNGASIGTNRNTPRLVRQSSNTLFTDFCAFGSYGQQAVLAEASTGEVWGWGKNNVFQTGVGATHPFNAPQKALVI